MEANPSAAHVVRCPAAERPVSPPPVGILKTLVEAISNLERATSPEAVWSVLKSYSMQYGFDYMLVLRGDDELAHGVASAVLYNDMPQGFVERFDLAGQSRNDPLALRTLTEVRPFTASELWAGHLNESQKRALALLSTSLNVIEGIVVPVRPAAALEGVVLLCGQKPDTSPIRRSTLQVLAHCAFERAAAIDASPKRKDGGLLSPRETECLRWAAAGKTDNEIGVILTISPRTARFHIENAKKKFGVSTRIQAVTEALRLKAIAA